MTVTNDERREVAKRLRELPTDMYEVEELWETKGLDTCCKDQTDYYLIHFALFGCFPADHMHPCDYKELHMRLADLIEPEHERMCSINADWYNGDLEHSVYRCSACGAVMLDDACYFDGSSDLDWFHYCPNCGAKVVDV